MRSAIVTVAKPPLQEVCTHADEFIITSISSIVDTIIDPNCRHVQLTQGWTLRCTTRHCWCLVLYCSTSLECQRCSWHVWVHTCNVLSFKRAYQSKVVIHAYYATTCGAIRNSWYQILRRCRISTGSFRTYYHIWCMQHKLYQSAVSMQHVYQGMIQHRPMLMWHCAQTMKSQGSHTWHVCQAGQKHECQALQEVTDAFAHAI